MGKIKSRWSEISRKYPEASASAQLFMCERLELKDLEKLKSFPVNAIRMLEDSIKTRAGKLIDTTVYDYGF